MTKVWFIALISWNTHTHKHIKYSLYIIITILIAFKKLFEIFHDHIYEINVYDASRTWRGVSSLITRKSSKWTFCVITQIRRVSLGFYHRDVAGRKEARRGMDRKQLKRSCSGIATRPASSSRSRKERRTLRTCVCCMHASVYSTNHRW